MTQRKRGGQKKHWAEKARIWTWYNEIKQSSNSSDYELDIEFAWKKEREPSTTERPRTFEWIRKKAREPRESSENWRSMTELVDVVDQHPWFEGTKALYEAELWSLFKERSVTPEILQTRIDGILETHGLVRIPFEELTDESLQLIRKYGHASIYKMCLLLSTENMAIWTHIELVWYLYILNEPTQNGEFRSVLEDIADISLNMFFLKYLPNHHLDYYSDAINALLNTKLDISSMDGGYGYLTAQGKMPVIPKSLVGKIREAHLLNDYSELS